MADNATDCGYAEPAALQLLLGSFAGLISVVTSLGNVFVLLAVGCSRALRRKQTAYLIANLALADLFVGATVMPLSAKLFFTNGVWTLNRTTCRIWVSLDVISCSASILTLMEISIDRLIGVTRPLHYNALVTRRRILVGNSLVWAVSVGILLATIQWGNESDFSSCRFCLISDEINYVLYSTLFSFYIPLIVVVSVYFKIYQVTRQRERRMILGAFYQAVTISARRQEDAIPRPSLDEYSIIPLRMHCRAPETKPNSYAKHKKSAKMLGIVIGAFLFCWIPFFVIHPANKICDCIPTSVIDLFTWLGYVNSTINPIIYALSMRSYAKAFRHIFASWYSSMLITCLGRDRSDLPISRTSSLAMQHSINNSSFRRNNHLLNSLTSERLRREGSSHSQFGCPSMQGGVRRSISLSPSRVLVNRKATYTGTIPKISVISVDDEMCKGQSADGDSLNGDDQPITFNVSSCSPIAEEDVTGSEVATREAGDCFTLDARLSAPVNCDLQRSSSWMNLKLYRMLISNESTEL